MQSKEDTMDRTIKASCFKVQYQTGKNAIEAVQGASFTLREGKSLGIVGESGSGKTSLALALMGLIDKPHITSGELCFLVSLTCDYPWKNKNIIAGIR